jgi:acyl carrier protein
LGQAAAVGLYPRPLQEELPIWLTASGGKETFEEAGRMGANVLTHLLGQTIEALLEKIALYRKARMEAGHDPDTGVVTLMLHTFLWESDAEAMALSREPFAEYLKAHVSLEKMAESLGWKDSAFTKAEEEELVAAAVEKYLRHQSLIGGVEGCLEKVRYLRRHGVDEIACFIDFGMERGLVMKSLERLRELGDRSRDLMDLDRLERALRARLPAYMVPSAFVVHQAFPKTPNGKVDRSQLGRMQPAGETDRKAGRAPESEAEVGLAALWREVLGVEVQRVEDNFFTLGGHSLLATRLVSRIRKAYGIDLRLRTLFESPTLGELAQAIAGAAKATRGTGDAIPKAVEAGGNSPLSFAQKRMWFLCKFRPDLPIYNTPFYIKVTGALDIKALEAAFSKVIERHESLRSFVLESEGNPEMGIGAMEAFSIGRNDLSALDSNAKDAALKNIVSEEAAEIFRLDRGPLLRAKCVKLGKEEHMLLITIHHIISDGWSIGILNRELSVIFKGMVSGREAALPPLELQYKDYSFWQEGRMKGGALAHQIGYWKRTLQGIPVELTLPFKEDRPSVTSYAGSRHNFRIGKGLIQRLKELGKRRGPPCS